MKSYILHNIGNKKEKLSSPRVAASKVLKQMANMPSAKTKPSESKKNHNIETLTLTPASQPAIPPYFSKSREQGTAGIRNEENQPTYR